MAPRAGCGMKVAKSGVDPALMREQRGWYWYDWANSAFYATVITVFLGPYLTTVAENAAGPDGVVTFLGLDLLPKAYFSGIVTISVFFQIVIMPVAAAIADHTGRKRELLALFAYLGAFATLGFYFVSGDAYLLGGVLFLVANVSYGAAVVVYNSFLPQISSAETRDEVSSRGWAFGYLGGGLLLAINLGLYLGRDALGLDEGLAVRICLASAGLWWAGFTIIPMLRLRNRPVVRGASEPGGQGGEAAAPPEPTLARAIGGSLRQLGRTALELRRYPRSLMFLVAFLVYNDGVETVIAFSATYAAHELLLGTTVQISAILMVQFVAFGGALLLGRLAFVFGTKRTVLGSLVIWVAVVAVGYFLQAGSAWQFYAMAFVIAIVLGGTQALSRSLFSLVIPAGKEAEYFSLFEISDKGSAFLGSLALTLALQLTDSYRTAILSLIVFFVLGFVLLVLTNLPRAIEKAGNEVPQHI
ncbi:MFS transporter [Thermopolyspora sp. NPDC052614]|uniref:MFS transporter n=1 Tax=Thermopolyspora sp. NPDC052614 TaxID=3155682 RepID=UPI00343D2314